MCCPVRRVLGLCLSLAVVSAVALFAIGADSAPGALLLRPDVGLSSDDLADAADGDVVVHSLPSDEDGEVAVVGIVRVDVPPAFFIERFRDIATFKKSRRVSEVGPFGVPPRVEDLAALTIPPGDLRDLRSCRVGDCDVQLPAHTIERFRTAIDWTSTDASAEADALFRRVLVEQVEAYFASGTRALPEYRDQGGSVAVSERTREILEASSYLRDHAPAIYQHLDGYQGGWPNGIDEFVYWSKEDLDLKPIVSLTHVVVRPWEVPGISGYWIASSQIYATHYLSGSLGITGFVEVAGSDGARSSYLIYLNRTRTEALGGFLGPIKRAIAGRRARGGMEETLTYARARLQGVYRQQAD